MKILMWNLMDTILGGVEKYLHDLTRELRLHGHEVVNIYPTSGERPQGSNNYYLPGLGPGRMKEVIYNLGKGYIRKEIYRLDAILAREKPDLLHVNNYFTPFLLKLLKNNIPIIHSLHDYYYVCPTLFKLLKKSQEICTFPLGLNCLKECYPPDQYFDYVMRYISREVVMEADRVVVFSNYMKGVLIKNGFQREKINVIPYFTDTPLHSHGSTDEPLILFVGRLSVEKGGKQLIQALKRIPNRFTVALIGDGPEKEALQKMIDGYGLNSKVRFTGWLRPTEIHKFYQRARVVVVPSIWPEPFGIVGLEAMAFAKPVVAFNVGGIPEWLIPGETGYLVPQNDITGLTEVLVKLLKDSPRAEEMGRNGQKRLKNDFSAERHVDHLLKLYKMALT